MIIINLLQLNNGGMYKAYQYRLYPTNEQSVLLDKHFGCVRLVYNLALECKQLAWKSGTPKTLSRFMIQKQLPELKEAYPFLKEVNAQSLQFSLKNLDAAYQNFFKGLSGFPRYKSKKFQQSFQCPQLSKVDFSSKRIRIIKFKEGIKYRGEQIFEGRIKTATIKKTNTGKYFASVLVDDGKELPEKSAIIEPTTIGIDVGLKHFCTISTGEKVNNPKFLQNQLRRLKVLQRRVSRKPKGSSNWKKAVQRVALLYERIRNQRTDFLHKLTTRLVSENQTIAVEDLNVKGMVRNRHLAKSISDVSWSEFFRQLEYKSEWRGRNLIHIGRFDASSKTCSCGVVNDGLTLNDRVWTCGHCRTTHDRDLLAAQNIKRFALNNKLNNLTPAGGREELPDVRFCNIGG